MKNQFSPLNLRWYYALFYCGCFFCTLLGGFVAHKIEERRFLTQMAVLANEPPPIFLPETPLLIAPIGCELRLNSRDKKTIEVWHNGELSSEIEPRDGTTYRVLREALANELSFSDASP